MLKDNLLTFLLVSATKKEKSVFVALALLRISLVFLDVAGLALVGLWASQLTGSPSPLVPASLHTSINTFFSSGGPFGFGIFILTLFLLKGIFAIVVNRMTANFASKFESRKSVEYLSKIMNGGLPALDQFPKSQLPYVLIDATAKAFGQAPISIALIVGELALLFSISLVLIILDFRLFALLLFVFTLIILAMLKFIGRRISKSARDLEANHLHSASLLVDVQNNFRTLVAQGKTYGFIKRFEVFRSTYAHANSEIVVTTALPRYFIEFGLIFSLTLAALPVVFGLEFELSTSTIAVFIAGSFRLVASIMPLQNQLNVFRKLRGESFKVRNFESSFPLGSERAQKQEISDRVRKIDNLSLEIQGLGLKHGDKWVCENINCKIPFGSFIKVNGPSGSGKSTFIDVLLGLRPPTEGSVHFYDGKVSMVNGDIYGNVGYVPQKMELIDGTLRENISLDFGLNGDDSLILDSLDAAGLKAFVSSIEEGLDLQISRQSQLSGGQIQRIAIARALYAKPKLLIIDEGTSSLDFEASSAVMETIDALKGSITIIEISHSDINNVIPDLEISFSLNDSKVLIIEPKSQ